MAEQKVSPKKLRGLKLEQASLDLRVKSYTYHEIGAALGVSHVGVYRAVLRGVARLVEENTQSADEYRAMQLQQIDTTLKKAFAIMNNSDNDNLKLQAIDRIHRGLERKSKLLGLDIAKDEPTATVIFEMVDGGILGGTVDAITSDSDAQRHAVPPIGPATPTGIS